MKTTPRFRIMLTFAILLMVIIPLLCASAYYFNTSRTMLIQTRMEQLESSLSYADTLYNIACEPYMNDQAIQNTINDVLEDIPYDRIQKNFNGQTQEIKASTYRQWRAKLQQYFGQLKFKTALMDGDYSAYFFYPQEGVLMDTNTTYYEDVSKSAFYSFFSLEENDLQTKWFETKRISYYSKQTDRIFHHPESCLSHVFTAREDADSDPYVVVVLNFDPVIFERISYRTQFNPDGQLLIYHKDGTLLSSTEYIAPFTAETIWEQINTKPFNNNIYLDRQLYLANYKTCGSQFVTVHLISEDIVLQALNATTKNILIAYLFIAAVFGMVAYWIAQRLYRPLDILITNMTYVSRGDLSKRISTIRNDEYGKVYAVYNRMLDQINELLTNVTNEKLLRAEAEIFLLQEQINPHFIYNSLEIIYSLAKLKRVDEIPQVVRALSDFYRICLSDGSADVPIKTALKICEKYIFIQNTRFMDKIRFTTEIPEELMQCMIPKYALQVLVENSVVHGLGPQMHTGHVIVSGSVSGKYIILSVSDDGVGITEEKIEQIHAQLQSLTIGSGNFALSNLNRQIVLKCGSDCGVHIYPNEEKGIRVEIKLPFRKEDDPGVQIADRG